MSNNILQKTLLVVASSIYLSACQTQPAQPIAHGYGGQAAYEFQLNLNKTNVYSWHLGQNAQGQNYLLIVLNQATLESLQKNGINNPNSSLTLTLGQQTFKNASQLQGGFLVLNSLPADWNEKSIAQLLN